MALEKLAITEETKRLSPLTQRMLLSLPILGLCNSLRRKKYVQAAVYASVAAYSLVRSANSNGRDNLDENNGKYLNLNKLRELGL